MHCLYLGVSRKLLHETWIRGKGGVRTPGQPKPWKMRNWEKAIFNNRLDSLKHQCPASFQRKVRNLDQVPHYKVGIKSILSY